MTNEAGLEFGTMADDAIEWLNEIRCWINRCKDTEWGDDDQRIVDFITSALQSPRVPVIPGLGDAITQSCYIGDFAQQNTPSDGYVVCGADIYPKIYITLCKFTEAARWFDELQKGV